MDPGPRVSRLRSEPLAWQRVVPTRCALQRERDDGAPCVRLYISWPLGVQASLGRIGGGRLGQTLGLDTAVGGRRSRGLGLREVRCLVSGSRMTVRAGEVADHLETGSLTPPGSGLRWVRRRRLSQFSRTPGTARHTDQCRTPRRGPRDGLRSGPGPARYRPPEISLRSVCPSHTPPKPRRRLSSRAPVR